MGLIACFRNGFGSQCYSFKQHHCLVSLYHTFVLQFKVDQYFGRVWISSANVEAVAAKGFKLIHAASDYFYLVRLSH